MSQRGMRLLLLQEVVAMCWQDAKTEIMMVQVMCSPACKRPTQTTTARANTPFPDARSPICRFAAILIAQLQDWLRVDIRDSTDLRRRCSPFVAGIVYACLVCVSARVCASVSERLRVSGLRVCTCARAACSLCLQAVLLLAPAVSGT